MSSASAPPARPIQPDKLSECPDALQNALDRGRAVQREVDRKIFQLNILYEASHEINTLNEPRDIFESFLLTAMGALGATKGFVILPAAESHKNLVAGRGLSTGEFERLELALATIHHEAATLDQFDATEPGQTAARLIIRNEPPPSSAFPRQTAIILGWCAGVGLNGLFGLGPKLTNERYTDEDTDLLSNLLNTLGQAVARAISAQTARELYRDLKRKHASLEHALQLADNTERELDRRIFHLNTVYDVTRELATLNDTQELMNAFLLALMGAFSLENSYLLLLDQAGDTLRLAHRGAFKDPPDIPVAEAKTLLFRCIGACDFEKLAPLNSQRIDIARVEPDQSAPSIFPAPTRLAILCRADEKCIGLVGLGPKLTAGEFTDEDSEVLLTLANNFLMFVKNSRSFETIQTLNRDLERRNTELQTTLDELKASRGKIEVLERAGAHVRAMLSRQTERLDRVSYWDFIWIAVGSLLLGLIFNAANPNGVELVPRVALGHRSATVGPDAAKRELDARTALLVDARPAEFYKQGHIPGAVNVPPTLFDFIYGMKFGDMDFSHPLIVYGRNISRLYDIEVASRLTAKGHDNIRVLILDGNLDAWKAKGFVVEE